MDISYKHLTCHQACGRRAELFQVYFHMEASPSRRPLRLLGVNRPSGATPMPSAHLNARFCVYFERSIYHEYAGGFSGGRGQRLGGLSMVALAGGHGHPLRLNASVGLPHLVHDYQLLYTSRCHNRLVKAASVRYVWARQLRDADITSDRERLSY